MAVDEAVLRLARPEHLYLRIYRWPDALDGLRGVTFGCSQRFEEVDAALRSRTPGITYPVIRRCTGGGIVYHDGDVTFSFVFPWPKLCAPKLMYRRIHNAAFVGLKARGVGARLWAPAAEAPKAPPRAECFSGPEPEDLVDAEGDKFLGGALRRRGRTGLYQGSMRPETLEVGPDRLRSALTEGFGLHWETVFAPVPLQREVAAEAERLRQEKYSDDGWNKRR